MKINIHIECEDSIEDVKTHLSVVRQQITTAIKRSIELERYGPINLSDSNCYGEHSISIEFDEQ